MALYQANFIQQVVNQKFPDLKTEIKVIKTKGDKILDVSLSKIGDKGLFTKELEVELVNGSIDLAVHSLKDLPTQLPHGLKLAAVSERGDIYDALISTGNKKLHELTPNDRIATSSLRRKASLLHYNSQFNIVDIRGNVNTRLKKMHDGHCDAMVMAYTGLKRLGLEAHVSEIISPEIIIPAVGQGAIAVETIDGNAELDGLMDAINHKPTWHCITGERAFMQTLEGGCQVPVGCISDIDGDNISLKGFVASVNGTNYLIEGLSGKVDSAYDLGVRLANRLKAKGAQEILDGIRLS